MAMERREWFRRARCAGGVPAAAACAAMLLLVGCQTDWSAARRSETARYNARLQEETREILEGLPDGVDLPRAMAIAKERNTRLAAGQIASKVAQMDRDAAFSVFLPRIQATYDALSLSEDPLIRFGEESVAMQDKDVRQASVQVVQPLFAPSAWLLYRSARRGAEIATLAQERTEQMIELSVASRFYQCEAAAEQEAQLDAEAESARELLRESEAMAREGYVADAELAGVRVLARERERALQTARRESRLARSRLLQLMDLWPLADLKLKTDALPEESRARYRVASPGEAVRELAAGEFTALPVEEWMFHALVSRREMQMQDRTVALRRNETLRALAMFLPNLVGFANYYKTSDSYTVNQAYWGAGLQASLSTFVGFRDVAAYRKARREVEGAYVEREETAMMVLLQVVEAYKTLQDAGAVLEVATAAAAAADMTLASADAQYRAGFVPLSRLLQAKADRSQAAARRNTAAFANAVALQAFVNVVGGGVERIAADRSAEARRGEPADSAEPASDLKAKGG
jgi:outer membrane protein TolC